MSDFKSCSSHRNLELSFAHFCNASALASALLVGATLSSRSRLITSALEVAIFSKSSGLDPGPKSWHLFNLSGIGGCRDRVQKTLTTCRLPAGGGTAWCVARAGRGRRCTVHGYAFKSALESFSFLSPSMNIR